MPKFTSIRNNFTSGELDPRLNARDDVAQYQNGLETCQNFQIMPYGGLKKRPGTMYVAGVKTNSKKVRLVSFEFNIIQTYILEFGDQYIRFYKDNGQILDGVSPYEVSSPYLESDLFELKFTQSADILYIAHPDYQPRKLSRTGDTSWTLSTITFEKGPFLDDNITSTTIKSSGVIGNVTLTASTSIFNSGHVGSIWKLTRGKLGSLVEESLTSLNDTTSEISLGGTTIIVRIEETWVGQITIERSFDNGSNWFGYETFTENTTKEFTDTRDVLFRCKMTQYTSGTATIRMAQLAPDTDGFGVVKITGYTSGTVVSATVIEELTEETIGDSNQHITNGTFDADITNWTDLSTVSASIAWNASQYMDLIGAAGSVSWAEQAVSIDDIAIEHYLSFDVGDGAIDLRIGTSSGGNEILDDTSYPIGSNLYAFTPGAATIYIQFKHSINATYYVDNVVLDSILADSDQTTYWAEGAWSDYRGWPRTIGFYEQRLFLASTDTDPLTVWGSVTGDFEKFLSGTNDDDSVQYTLNSEGVNLVQWMVPWKILALGTAAAEWRISGSTLNEALTPTNVIAKAESKEGSGNIQAIQIAKSIIFIDRTLKNIRELSYTFNEDAYEAPILNQLAKHLTDEYTIIDFAYQKNPDSIIWFVLSSGEMIGLTYNPSQQIVAFYTFITDGEIESVSVIPGASAYDEVWISVKRTINGSDVRYVEYLNDPNSTEIEDQFYVDCGLTYSGEAATTLSGLDHLEGETVQVLGNGSIYPEKTVSSGQITVSPSVTKAHIGLGYTSLAKTMPVTDGAADGTGQGRLKRIYDLTFNLYKSIVMKYGKDENNLDELFFLKSTNPFLAPSLFTGLKTNQKYQGDVDETQQLTIVSDKPVPLNLLSVTFRCDTSQL